MCCRVPICRKRYATKKVQTHTRAHIHLGTYVCLYIVYIHIMWVCIYIYIKIGQWKKKQHSIFVTKQIEIVQSVRSPGHNVRMLAMIGGRSSRALCGLFDTGRTHVTVVDVGVGDRETPETKERPCPVHYIVMCCHGKK